MRFLLDEHLGRLARDLRMLGVDAALVAPGSTDDAVLAQAAREDRLILTRDRELVARAQGRARFVTPRHAREQLAEIRATFPLDGRPLSRCLVCNTPLRLASDAEKARAPANVQREHEEFFACPGCQRVYWEGSHYRRMQTYLADDT